MRINEVQIGIKRKGPVHYKGQFTFTVETSKAMCKFEPMDHANMPINLKRHYKPSFGIRMDRTIYQYITQAKYAETEKYG